MGLQAERLWPLRLNIRDVRWRGSPTEGDPECCPAGGHKFWPCLFLPRCARSSLASFGGGALWFPSAPCQEPGFNRWFLHLLMPWSHRGVRSKVCLFLK